MLDHAIYTVTGVGFGRPKRASSAEISRVNTRQAFNPLQKFLRIMEIGAASGSHRLFCFHYSLVEYL